MSLAGGITTNQLTVQAAATRWVNRLPVYLKDPAAGEVHVAGLFDVQHLSCPRGWQAEKVTEVPAVEPRLCIAGGERGMVIFFFLKTQRTGVTQGSGDIPGKHG